MHWLRPFTHLEFSVHVAYILGFDVRPLHSDCGPGLRQTKLVTVVIMWSSKSQ
jgi:hypothetical protein